MSPIVSSAARSVLLISSGVIFSFDIPVKFALKREESFAIIPESTEIGRCTSLFLTVLLLSIATIMNVLASIYIRSKRFIVAGA